MDSFLVSKKQNEVLSVVKAKEYLATLLIDRSIRNTKKQKGKDYEALIQRKHPSGGYKASAEVCQQRPGRKHTEANQMGGTLR